MHRSRKGAWRLVALAAVVSLVLAACGSDDDGGDGSATGGGEAKTVTIGFVGAKTGDNANLGLNIRDGIKVAIAEENALDDGVTIELKEFDTGGDPAQATTVAPQFLGDDSIIATVGPAFSGETKALIPLYQDAGLPFVSPSATNVALPETIPEQPVFHRIIADDALQASGVTKYLVDTVKPKSVAYIHDNTEYGKGLADGTEAQAEEAGVKTAVSAALDPKAQDYSATVNQVRSSGADTVFYAGYYAEAGRLRKQLVDANVEVEFITGDGSLDPGFITAAGAAQANGAKITCPCNLAFATSEGELKEFYDNFREEIGKDPGLYSPEAYDATKLIIKGIKAGNDTREKMLEYLENDVGTYEGVSKTIEFEENGNIKSTEFFVFEVKDGKLAPGTKIEAEKPSADATTTTTGG